MVRTLLSNSAGRRVNTTGCWGWRAELDRRQVAVIVTAGINAALAAKQATTTIPIVAVGIGDPLRTGLVASLSPPADTSPGTRSSARKKATIAWDFADR